MVSIPVFTGEFDDLLPGELAAVISKVCRWVLWEGVVLFIDLRATRENASGFFKFHMFPDAKCVKMIHFTTGMLSCQVRNCTVKQRIPHRVFSV